jgi:TetR/AcrR family transcriptional repressor of nem operon
MVQSSLRGSNRRKAPGTASVGSLARSKQPVVETGAESFSFRDWIVQKQQSVVGKRKGERTRDRLRLCTIELLNEVGYRDLKLTDICQRAKTSPPVLYLYFPSKEALVSDILVEFLQEFMDRASSSKSRTPYEAMYGANLQWIRLARSNAGLMRCLLQFSEEQRDFAELFARKSAEWNMRITSAIVHRFPVAQRDEAQIDLIVHALSGMIDELTRRLFANNDERLASIVGTVAPSDEALAEVLTTLWHRALYCADPPKPLARPLAPRLLTAFQAAEPAKAVRKTTRRA